MHGFFRRWNGEENASNRCVATRFASCSLAERLFRKRTEIEDQAPAVQHLK